MSDYLEQLQLKRQQAQQVADKEASEGAHRENLGAVTDSGKSIVDATVGLAKSEDIDTLLKEFKEVRLAQYMAASAKSEEPQPTIILRDQTDLGGKLAELGDRIAETIAKLDSSKFNTEQLSGIKQLTEMVATAQKSNDATTKATHKELIKALKSLDLSPSITVPEPKVTIKETKIDFSPLQNTMRDLWTPKEVEIAEKVDLECYHAQDIDNSNKDMQYIGFLNTEGEWYIIENDVKGNKLRYVFGDTGYQKAFSMASSYEYSLLNEAINALQA